MSEMYADFHMEVRGNTLVIQVTGSTGVFELEWLRQQIADKYLKYLSKPWAILGDARQWELYTPEVKEAMKEFAQWSEDQGMGYNIVLAPENSIKLVAAQNLRLGDVIEHNYVSSMEECIEWLSARQLWGERKV